MTNAITEDNLQKIGPIITKIEPNQSSISHKKTSNVDEVHLRKNENDPFGKKNKVLFIFVLIFKPALKIRSDTSNALLLACPLVGIRMWP